MKRLNGKFFILAFRKAAERLLANKDEINALNVFPVPDGDTGSNMSAAVLEALSYLDKLKSDDLSDVSEAVKTGMLMGARGNSGVILSQIFRGFAEGAKEKKLLTTKAFTEALQSAKEVAYKSVIKPVEGTMLTVIRVVADRARDELADVEEFEEYFKRISEIAFETVDLTPTMLAKLREAGVVDAGAKGLAYIFEGFNLAAQGDTEAELLETGLAVAGGSAEKIVEVVKEELKYTYCTELIIALDDQNNEEQHEICDSLKSYLEEMGDSIVIVNQDNIIKIHIHTDHPGEVIEKFISYGQLQKVKIDNMKLQHEHVIEVQEAQQNFGEGKVHGIVAVSPGEGLSEIMKSLGADILVKGGQTMNPSMKDIYDSIERLEPNVVILLPNNPNIILTAKEAANAVMEKNPAKKVYIIPTRSVQEGISALAVYDDSMDTDELIKEMEEAAERVAPISITYAIRDSSVKGKKVRKGEYIALGKDKLFATGRKLEKVAFESIKKVLDENEDYEIATIFYGKDIKEEAAKKLMDYLSDEFENLEFELHNGGQPYYYYLIAIE